MLVFERLERLKGEYGHHMEVGYLWYTSLKCARYFEKHKNILTKLYALHVDITKTVREGIHVWQLFALSFDYSHIKASTPEYFSIGQSIKGIPDVDLIDIQPNWLNGSTVTHPKNMLKSKKNSHKSQKTWQRWSLSSKSWIWFCSIQISHFAKHC